MCCAKPRRPAITYPENLPVSQKKQDILEAVRDHQVVIVAGETGSGKTTQLPKICMELGRGVKGLIGHTQPRRLAARTVANRIAEELQTEPGGCIGYKVRFSDHVSDNTMVKLMTDGILLAEIQQDRLLMQYDTIIIDEAHERSLNIDFLLGYLKELLPRRPDLKVIITSATIDPERFSHHFNNAPIIEVSGRTYPVEVRYRPIVEEADDTERDQLQAIFDAVDELGNERRGRHSDLHERRARNPRYRRCAEQARPAPHRDSAAVCAPVQQRAEPRLPAAQRAPHRAGDQRGGNLADRAGHQICDRSGHGAHQPLQLPHQGAAAAD